MDRGLTGDEELFLQLLERFGAYYSGVGNISQPGTVLGERIHQGEGVWRPPKESVIKEKTKGRDGLL